MGGMMGGMGAQAAPMAAPMARAVGPGGVATGNAMGAVAPTPAVAGIGNAGGGGFMDKIMGALMDPEGTAADMARTGVSPDDLMQNVQKNSLMASLQPTERAQAAGGRVGELMSPQGQQVAQVGGAGASPSSTQQVVQPQPGGAGSLLQDLGSLITGGQTVGTPAPQAQQAAPKIKAAQVASPAPAAAGSTAPGVRSRPAPQPSFLDALREILGGGGAGGPGSTPGSVAPASPVPVQPPAGASVPSIVQAGATQPPAPPPVEAAPAMVPPEMLDAPAAVTPVQSDYIKRLKEGGSGATVMGGAAGSPAAGLSKNSVYNDFIAGVRTKVTNPYGLAAIAATGQHESSFAEKNLFRTWNDPSESGQAGRSGGVMSWRAERYQAMRKFVSEHGGDPDKPSARLQGEFMANEDPGLVERLNAAKSVEEANDIMRKSWKFKGWENTQSGEGARRLATARNLVSSFGGEAGTTTPSSETTTSTPETPAEKAKALSDQLAELGDSLAETDASAEEDQGPTPPGALLPRQGEYQVDPNVMKLMLLMLSPAAGFGGVPSLTQLMSGAGGAQRNG